MSLSAEDEWTQMGYRTIDPLVNVIRHHRLVEATPVKLD